MVLSACQANPGNLSEGDELVGLMRACIFAGTPNVVASLWVIDDEATSLLMEHFYTHLRDGMGKAKALRQAQIEVREEYPNPYYWAAFVLSGDGGAVLEVQTSGGAEEQGTQSDEDVAPFLSWSGLVGVLLVIVLLVGGAIVWQRRKMLAICLPPAC